MRIVVFGAGGVGSVVAGHLARAGVEAVMVARPAHADAVRREGLRVTGLSSFRVELPALDDARSLESADALLIAVKTKDMDDALAATRHLRVGGVASLQNGVVKNEQMRRVFGAAAVIGATTMIGATLTAPGSVDYSLDGVTFFGEPAGARSERSDALAAAFQKAGLHAASVDNITSIEWTKQAIQNPFAPLAAATRLPVHRVWSDPQLATLSVHMFREVAAVADALGIALSQHPAWSLFDLATLRDAPFADAVAMLVRVGEQVTESGRTHIVPSMLQDVLAGKRTEVEETVGHVYREGLRLGIAVPYTEFAYRTLRAIESHYDARLTESEG